MVGPLFTWPHSGINPRGVKMEIPLEQQHFIVDIPPLGPGLIHWMDCLCPLSYYKDEHLVHPSFDTTYSDLFILS